MRAYSAPKTHYRDNGDNSHRPGTVYTWPVNNIPQRDSQTIFVQLRVKDQVQDEPSRSLNSILVYLRFVNSQSDNNSNTGTTIYKTDTKLPG